MAIGCRMETVRLVHVGISLKRITSMSIAHLWHFLRHPHLQPDDGIPVNTDKTGPGPTSTSSSATRRPTATTSHVWTLPRLPKSIRWRLEPTLSRALSTPSA